MHAPGLRAGDRMERKRVVEAVAETKVMVVPKVSGGGDSKGEAMYPVQEPNCCCATRKLKICWEYFKKTERFSHSHLRESDS